MTSYFEFHAPVKIVAGPSALEHLPFELASLGCKRPLLLTDAGVRAAGLADLVEAAMKAGGAHVVQIFDGIPPDSSTEVVATIADTYRRLDCDGILALGGGSVMDTAKGANILASLGGDSLHGYLGAGAIPRRLRPLIAIPTTAGTGSEVTLAAVIKDDETGVKLPFASPFLLPDVAVLDPRLTEKLPGRLTAATAMDALTHAIESVTGLARNAMSDAYAHAAIAKIRANIVRAIDHPDDLDARLELAVAALLAGVAFSNSMVGLVHSLGHSVGALCHVHHGMCMGVLLPRVLEYNLEQERERIGGLLLPLAGAERFAKTAPAERARATIAEIDALKDALHAKVGLPRTLRETGKVSEDQLEEIARMALDDGTIVYNPVEVSFEEALGVLRRAY